MKSLIRPKVSFLHLYLGIIEIGGGLVYLISLISLMRNKLKAATEMQPFIDIRNLQTRSLNKPPSLLLRTLNYVQGNSTSCEYFNFLHDYYEY
jgi:hypothetical protein